MLWMNDLTAPDRLNIGFIPYVGGLPVLAFAHGRFDVPPAEMTPSTGDPVRKIDADDAGCFCRDVSLTSLPAVLYWLVNNILSIAQQYWVNRQA
jgi:YidC/Oxa1 family membrane protein insertase